MPFYNVFVKLLIVVMSDVEDIRHQQLRAIWANFGWWFEIGTSHKIKLFVNINL